MYIQDKRGWFMDKFSFTCAVEKYQAMVYRVAFHSLGNAQDADDGVQEVFLRYTGDFDRAEHLRRWLLRVAVNYCRDVLKSPWRKRRAELDEAYLPAFEQPEEQVLYEAVMELPEKYRTVLDLFYYEDLSVKEIAGLLRIDTSAVTTRLSRARAQLKLKLKEAWQDE